MSKEGNLPNFDTQLDLSLGPGSSLTGEILWDQSQVRPANGPKLLVKIAALFSLTENIIMQEKMEKDEKAGDDVLNALRNTVEEEHKQQLNEKDREILRIQAENEKLKAEGQKIENKISNPDEDALKQSAENQEIEKAKEYYLNKNVEIEQLIQQVMSGDYKQPADAAADGGKADVIASAKSLMGQSPEQIESLLRFLIYLVLHKEKMDPAEYNK